MSAANQGEILSPKNSIGLYLIQTLELEMANKKHARIWEEFAYQIAEEGGNTEISDDLKAALSDVYDNMNDDTYTTTEEAMGAIGKAIDSYEPEAPDGVFEKLWQALKIAIYYAIT